MSSSSSSSSSAWGISHSLSDDHSEFKKANSENIGRSKRQADKQKEIDNNTTYSVIRTEVKDGDGTKIREHLDKVVVSENGGVKPADYHFYKSPETLLNLFTFDPRLCSNDLLTNEECVAKNGGLEFADAIFSDTLKYIYSACPVKRLYTPKACGPIKWQQSLPKWEKNETSSAYLARVFHQDKDLEYDSVFNLSDAIESITGVKTAHIIPYAITMKIIQQDISFPIEVILSSNMAILKYEVKNSKVFDKKSSSSASAAYLNENQRQEWHLSTTVQRNPRAKLSNSSKSDDVKSTWKQDSVFSKTPSSSSSSSGEGDMSAVYNMVSRTMPSDSQHVYAAKPSYNESDFTRWMAIRPQDIRHDLKAPSAQDKTTLTFTDGTVRKDVECYLLPVNSDPILTAVWVWSLVKQRALKQLTDLGLSPENIDEIANGVTVDGSNALKLKIPKQVLDYYIGSFMCDNNINDAVMNVADDIHCTFRPLKHKEGIDVGGTHDSTKSSVTVEFSMSFGLFDQEKDYKFKEQSEDFDYFTSAFGAKLESIKKPTNNGL